MPRKTKSSPSALAYARALLELAEEQGQMEPVGEELRQLREVLEQFPAFAEFLRNPGIGEADRSQAIERVLGGRVSGLLWNFLRVLNAHRRLGLLPELHQAYDELLDERFGRVEVDVTVAQRLTDEQLEQVRQRVSEALGKQAVVHQYVDESIIGGLILRVGDRLIDASVRQQLRSIREQLLAARTRTAAIARDFGTDGGNGQAGGGETGGARVY